MSSEEEQEQDQKVFMKRKLFMMGSGDLIIGENPGKGLPCLSDLGKDYFVEPKKNGATCLTGQRVFALRKLVLFKLELNNFQDSDSDLDFK